MKKKTTKKKVKKSPKKIFHLTWVLENLEELPGFYTKRMFGGLSAYAHDKMMLMLAESPGERTYRDKECDFEIWNGILFPTHYEFQESLQEEFPVLIQHPVLKKWLYLPLTTPDFESLIHEITECIVENDERFGIYPKMD